MIFRKKKRMVDMRELQKRGVVVIPKNEVVVPMNTDGFVEMGSEPGSPASSVVESSSSGTDFLGFMGSSDSSSSADSFSTSSEGYDKREVDEKITGLDNKIYKLEQRIELLERKAGVEGSSNGSSYDSSSENSVGAMGW